MKAIVEAGEKVIWDDLAVVLSECSGKVKGKLLFGVTSSRTVSPLLL